jgi:hypothetical protein
MLSDCESSEEANVNNHSFDVSKKRTTRTVLQIFKRKHSRKTIEENVLDTNAGKQLS